MRDLRMAYLLASLVTLASCAGPEVFRAYLGPERPASEVGLIKGQWTCVKPAIQGGCDGTCSVRIEKIDGREFPSCSITSCPVHAATLPGIHTVEASYSCAAVGDSDANAVLTFEVMPGQVYEVRGVVRPWGDVGGFLGRRPDRANNPSSGGTGS